MLGYVVPPESKTPRTRINSSNTQAQDTGIVQIAVETRGSPSNRRRTLADLLAGEMQRRREVVVPP